MKLHKLFALSVVTLLSSLSVYAADFTQQLLKNITPALLVLRQDYQLVDEDSGDVQNADGKEYYGREYSVMARVGENQFMISLAGVKPWQSASLSKHSKFQPKVSASAFCGVGMPEYESFDFEEDELNQLTENRIFTLEASEEPGLNVCGVTEGTASGYVVVVASDAKNTKDVTSTKFHLEISPLSVTVKEDVSIYNVTLSNTAIIGGIFIIPVSNRIGLYDFCVAGQLQKIGGVWKLITISNGSPLYYSYHSGTQMLNDMAFGLASDMSDTMSDAISKIFNP